MLPETVVFKIEEAGIEYTIRITPFLETIENDVPFKFNLYINDKYEGKLINMNNGWAASSQVPVSLVEKIGCYIETWYE